jgi:hypothetical protein
LTFINNVNYSGKNKIVKDKMIAWCSQFWKLQDIVLPLMPEQNIARFFNGAVAISKPGFYILSAAISNSQKTLGT